MLPLAQVKERIRAERHRAQGARARRAEGAGHGRRARARASRSRRRPRRRGSRCRRARPSPAARPRPCSPRPTLVARVFALKPGEAEKEGFALPQGAAFVSLAEIQPARAPELEDVQRQGAGRPRRGGGLRAGARGSPRRVRAKAETLGLEKAAAAVGPRAQGDAGPHRPRPAARRPRHRRGPRGGGLLAAREDAQRARAHGLRAGRSCACSRRSPSTPPSSRGRRAQIAASLRAAEAVGAVPGVRGRGARALRDHAQREGVPPRARRRSSRDREERRRHARRSPADEGRRDPRPQGPAHRGPRRPDPARRDRRAARREPPQDPAQPLGGRVRRQRRASASSWRGSRPRAGSGPSSSC